MNKFKSIYPSDSVKFHYCNDKYTVYLDTTISTEKYKIVKINCNIGLEEDTIEFPQFSSKEEVASFFTNVAEKTLIGPNSFLPQLKNDVEKTLNIEKSDFENYKISFDIDLELGNNHSYYELPGQPLTSSEAEEEYLVREFQADLYFALKNMFYKPENDKFLKQIFWEYKNFFISCGLNYATQWEENAAVYSTKHPFAIDVSAQDVIYK